MDLSSYSSGNNYVQWSGGDNSYSDTMGSITRAQYQDWLERFAPTEEKLIELATGDQLYTELENRNQETAEGNLQRAQSQAASSLEKYGLSDSRTDSQKNNLELTNALSLASMNNEGRQAVGNLQRNIIAGTSSSATQSINDLGG
ncbi:hypothetical protein D0812_22200 [Vibrio owensii]|uniref:Uncharacterized protein n=1 Tax=Vibrio owensii TaxID=696485 RepID=A0AAP9GFM1_9VIBR|nr:hypothetical protein [Vibrio owensii]AYO17104.1 hypothetical protein D0812_22200 [Vibrio owensii]QGH49249.1 hypothetical protein APZ19_19210 [Vibrio owensii]